ncbi:TPA: 4Fe-4S binding protein [bacterium]|jgi:ferredoxin|nr:4Fe-4S binding protein [bacterium]
MNALIYFSATGETKKVNDYYQNKLPNLNVFDITDYDTRVNFNHYLTYNMIILSIPVYSENVPLPVRNFLNKLKCKYLIVNLTYGSISVGRTLKNIKKLISPSISLIGAALIPSKHTYYNNVVNNDFNELQPLLDKYENKDYTPINIPKLKGHFLSPILEKQRTKYNIKIKFNPNKCIKCNLCINKCPVNAINNYHKINKNCLRCLRCVTECPNKAYTYKRSKLLTLYLKNKIKPQSIIVIK